jgi:hypothetical protein
LRDSVESLNLKFDENRQQHQQQHQTRVGGSLSLKSSNSNSSTNSNCTSRFSNYVKHSLAELNEEFSKIDSEFSANTWADMQNEAVKLKEILSLFFLDLHQ